MKNDDFWKSQFAKHDAVPDTGKPPITPASPKPLPNPASIVPNAISATDESLASRLEETIQVVRPAQSIPGFEKSLQSGLSRFPAKAKIRWEQWLLNRKAVLIKR